MPLLHEATLVRVDMIFCRFLESDVCSECNRAEYVYIRPRRTLVIVGRRQAKSFSGSKSKCVVSVTHPFPYSHVAAGGLPTAVQSRPMVYSTYSQLLLRTISCNSFLASLLSCWSSNIYTLSCVRCLLSPPAKLSSLLIHIVQRRLAKRACKHFHDWMMALRRPARLSGPRNLGLRDRCPALCEWL